MSDLYLVDSRFVHTALSASFGIIWTFRRRFLVIIIIIIINILTAIGLAPGGSSPVHIYREHYIEYTNNTQNT